MKEWVKMPSYWLRDKENLPLAKMKWIGIDKSNQIAGLMVFIVLVQHSNSEITVDKQELGLCKLTYSELSDITGLSRAKVAGGLKILIKLEVISQISTGRNNVYKIENYTAKGGWAKLPAKGLYNKTHTLIPAFQKFNLRTKNELSALKIYLLIISFRTDSTNYAQISYTRISDYTGIHRNEIKAAISLLINLGMVHVDSGDSEINQYSTVNLYRPCFLEVYKHRGTISRDF